MTYTDDQLSSIFDKTGGRCHISGRRLCFGNYGRLGSRGGWEVDHSKAKALGGSDNLGNLFPTSISVNRSKGARSSRSVRAEYGLSRKPMSMGEQEDARLRQSMLGGLGGFLLGKYLELPPGSIALGCMVVAIAGYYYNPE